MIRFADPSKIAPEILALSPDFMDWPYLTGHFDKLPERFRPVVSESYASKRQGAGQYDANRWIASVGEVVTERGANLSASDDELCRQAKENAKAAAGMLADLAAGQVITPAEIIGKLSEFCQRNGAEAPAVGAKGVTLQGLIARLTDAAWWRRQLRRNVARDIEGVAIGLGMVSNRAGVYASDETCQRHAEQQRRNAKAMQQTEAVNEEGHVFTLAELAEKGIGNPNIRRAELMTRIRGFEDFAKGAGHVGLFYTWTCPSRMHARYSKSGQENPKFDGTTPKAAAQFLGQQWAKARAWLNRRGLYPYGFRVAEPHHDGTPHWHLLLFIAADVAETMTECVRKYALEPDAHELTSAAAIGARFTVVKIDWERGSAAGYIAKYVCKNIDGKKTDGESLGEDFDAAGRDAIEGAARVRAWASCWGIRQFQQIGGPGVTIWRELRRLDDVKQGELFPHWSAADVGNWGRYVETMGGIEVAKKDRPVQVWREVLPGKLNRYGEQAAKEVLGVECAGAGVETRIHEWEIRRAGVKKGKENVQSVRVSVGATVGRVAVPEVPRGWGLGTPTK